jgi:hypothetical protein
MYAYMILESELEKKHETLCTLIFEDISVEDNEVLLGVKSLGDGNWVGTNSIQRQGTHSTSTVGQTSM